MPVQSGLQFLQSTCCTDSYGFCFRLRRAETISRPHFFKLFRENTGVTPAIYANTMRIEKALDRLVRSHDSITDIGFELGFSSQSHFTHFFSAHVGVAPTPYRSIARVVSE